MTRAGRQVLGAGGARRGRGRGVGGRRLRDAYPGRPSWNLTP